MSEKLKIGQIIYYAIKPIAWLMKPQDAIALWKVGLLVGYKTDNTCIILDNNGEHIVCQSSMIIPFQNSPIV